MRSILVRLDGYINHVEYEAYRRGYEDGKADTPFTDTEEAEKKAYQRGLEDAWECARKITVDNANYPSHDELESIFDYKCNCSYEFLEKFTAQEAMQKIKEYEEQIAYHDDFATALEKMNKYEERHGFEKEVSEIVNKAMEERQTGEWIYTGMKDEWYAREYECSLCGGTMLGESDFCPNCGADMRKESHDNT